jgi:hypothetical protein
MISIYQHNYFALANWTSRFIRIGPDSGPDVIQSNIRRFLPGGLDSHITFLFRSSGVLIYYSTNFLLPGLTPIIQTDSLLDVAQFISDLVHVHSIHAW